MFLRDLIHKLGGEAVGEVDQPVHSVGNIDNADARQITFLANPKYRAALASTRAGAVIVSPGDRDVTSKPRIVAANPYAYFARVAQLFSPPPQVRPGVHPGAVVHASASIAATAEIAEFVSIGEGAVIGEGVYIGPGCVLGAQVSVGAGTRLNARVTLYAGSHIGARCIVHAGAVIGADGFGFAPEKGSWLKIPQTGRTVIGDDCEIGANTTIDRGALDDTVVGNDVKIDNLVQIGHNCAIGDHTVIAGCTGISGSTRIGKHVMIGGAASITGHIEICDEAIISGNTFITKSITEPGTYTSGMPHMTHRDWLRNAVHLRRLDAMAKAIKELGEKK